MTDLAEYLTVSERERIAEEMFREEVSKALSNERRLSNLIYDVAQKTITETLESQLGAGWRKRLVVRATKAIEDGEGLKFHIFRKADRWDSEDGPGVAPLKEAVEKHADRIEARVMDAIDSLDDYDLGALLRSALTNRLGGA